MKRFGRKKEFTTTRIIAVGFFVAIVIGTFLLMLPLSSKTGKVMHCLLRLHRYV